MTVQCPGVYRRRRDYLRSPIGRSPVRDALGELQAMSFLLSSSVGGAAIPDSAVEYDLNQESYSDGDSINSLSDLHGSDDFTQATSSKQPTYKNNIINGNPVARFDGSSHFMQASLASALSSPFQIFILGQLRSTSGSSYEDFFDGGSANQAAIGSDSSGNWFIRGDNAASNLTDGSDDTNVNVYNLLFASSGHIRINGTTVATGDAESSGPGTLSIGARADDDLHADFDFNWIVGFDSELSSSDDQTVEQALANRGGVSI